MLGEFTLDLRPLAEREALVHGIAVGELALAGHQRKQPTQTCHRLRTAFLDDFGKRRAIEWLALIPQHVALTEWQQRLERARPELHPCFQIQHQPPGAIPDTPYQTETSRVGTRWVSTGESR